MIEQVKFSVQEGMEGRINVYPYFSGPRPFRPSTF
jgi:hypothetical protein